MGALTEHRAKPALPFAGLCLIDFPLSNCANSGIGDIWALQQYQPHSLEDHLANGRPWDLDRTLCGFVDRRSGTALWPWAEALAAGGAVSLFVAGLVVNNDSGPSDAEC